MEKTTKNLNDLLSQFLSLRNEVSEIADKTADAVFDSVESGDITKEEALTILTDNKLLPVANWICLPDFMDDYDYFSRYSNRDNAISEFRESLNRAISDASWVLCDEDKLKIMIEVASEFCYT